MSAEVEVTDDVLASMPLPDIDGDADKHDRGTVVVIGGSVETPGAVILAGLAALRVGAGRLRIVTDAEVAPHVAVALPEARVVGGTGALDEHLAAADAILVGSGWLAPDRRVMGAVAAAARGLVVVDAAALEAAAPVVEALGERVVLLPNAQEAEQLATSGSAVVSVRGAETRTTAPGRPVYVDRRGTPGLATSGSGDVAAGIVAGLAARGAGALPAALWGARLHRLAGEALGGPGFLARELLDALRGEIDHCARSVTE